MIRKSVIFWVGLTSAASAVLYQTSYRVQGMEEKLAGVHRSILAEQDAIQVLKAEWSFLNEPARLEKLARHHLPLQSTAGEQVTALDAGPTRLALLAPMPPRPVAAPAPAPVQLATVAAPPANTTTALVIPAAVTTTAAKAPVRKPAAQATAAAPANGTANAKPARATARPAAPRLAPRPAPTDDLGLFLARLEREP